MKVNLVLCEERCSILHLLTLSYISYIVISELWKTDLDETTAECKTGWKTVLTEY